VIKFTRLAVGVFLSTAASIIDGSDDDLFNVEDIDDESLTDYDS